MGIGIKNERYRGCPQSYSHWAWRIGYIFPQVRRLFYLGKSAFWKLRVSASGRIHPYGAASRTRIGIQIRVRQETERKGVGGREGETEREDSCSSRCAGERCSCCFVQRIHQFHGQGLLWNLRECSVATGYDMSRINKMPFY